MQSLGPILLLFIAATSNANRSDMGLPASAPVAWVRDIAIGVVACLAAIIPVGMANAAARIAFNAPDELTKHPLVEMLMKSEPNMVVLVLATLMAAVVAPIGEEITFRLLLQGWLEKWEDSRLGRRNSTPNTSTEDATDAVVASDTPPDFVDDAPVHASVMGTAPPARGIAGLPHGWAPIILSSLLFAAAHYGYGPEPVPLFVLALFLGYCYQRTHRIIPCIVAHGLFNLFSMIALWRVVLITTS
jgi:membrane protease YdiL (CAAX protease family)